MAGKVSRLLVVTDFQVTVSILFPGQGIWLRINFDELYFIISCSLVLGRRPKIVVFFLIVFKRRSSITQYILLLVSEIVKNTYMTRTPDLDNIDYCY